MNDFMEKTLVFVLATIVISSNMLAKTNQGKILVSGGATLYYEEKGNGEPIILLHGHSLDTRMWDKQYYTFAKYYRTIRFDFRGYGRSSEQTETFQFTHKDDLLTLMDSLHIAKAHIVGLSMGAFVAADLLSVNPERIISCVMASGGLRLSKGPSEPMDSVESAKRDKEIKELKIHGVDNMKKEWLEGLIASGGSQREKIRRPLSRMINDWSAWQPLHKEVRVIVGKDAFAQLIKTHPLVPTLIIVGGAKSNHPDAHPFMLNYLPNGRVVVMSDCGHMLNMEKPKEFNRIVLDFIRSVNK